MDIHTSHTTLDYPLYVCDFDPADAGRLIVGGGGGGSRTGVGNKLTLLNTSKPDDAKLSSTSEVELSNDEDSVTSFAAGPRRGRATLAYAGINSSVASLKKGKNAHFRVFSIDTPSSSASSATGLKMAELARVPFFSPASETDPDIDTYQRIVRVSAPFSDGHGSTLPQLGACATGMSKRPQIVIFDVTSAAPAAAAPSNKSTAHAAIVPQVRGILDLSKDAADLDVVQTGADQFQLAYCTDHELFLFDVTTKGASSESGTSKEPYLAYEIVKDEATGMTVRPTFRSIRYVTPRFILAVVNLPKRSGAFLLGLRLPDISSPAVVAAGDRARITISANLPRTVSQATGLAVRNLSPPSAPGARQADRTQFVVAVAGTGSDISLSLYTLEYQTAGGSTELLARLYPFRTIKAVHEQPMTCLALSHFIAPSPSSSTAATTQYLRLASVSVKNTVVVQYIPLRKLPAITSSSTSSASAAAAAAAAALNPPRYVVALKSRAPSGTPLIAFASVLLVVASLVAQAVLEIMGKSQPLLGARELVPITWLSPLPLRYAAIDRLALAKKSDVVADIDSVVADTPGNSAQDAQHDNLGAMPEMHPVAAFLSNSASNPNFETTEDGNQQVLFMRGEDSDHTIEIAVHDEAEHGPAVAWENLGEEQQATWRQRLQKAGHWTEDMGETVFRGVLFGELAGLAGALVR